MNIQEAVQIVEKVGGSYKLNEAALREILEQNNVMGSKIAVVTVAGAFRKGKSFFLSNCVRYFQCEEDGDDWMDPDASINGFAWKQSRDSVTEGILMWPEPFIAKDRNGKEIAILLMDTEGAFDHKTSMKQCATVFALSALLSSVLVFNVSQDIQEDTLNHLQFFASYGSYALSEENGASPFQSLLFLVRDWQNDDDFGLEAGGRLLNEKLECHDSSNSSMQNLRRDLRRSFRDMKCCLLPNPGDKIRAGSEGEITVNDMLPEFREELGEFVPQLFDSLLPPKEIAGKQITGAEFLSYFKTYTELFASGKVPEPKSIFDATAEASHQAALDHSVTHYMDAMKLIFSQLIDNNFFEVEILQTIHYDMSNASIKIFEETKKMGNLPQFFYALEEQLEEKFTEVFLKDNENRITITRVKREKEEAEKRRIEQEQKSREERIKHERDQEMLRIQVEQERRQREETEKRRLEQEREAREDRMKHEKEQERLRLQMEKDKRAAAEEAERRRVEDEQRYREQRERDRREREEEDRQREKKERERRERDEEAAEQIRQQMERMKLEIARKDREREEERRRDREEQQEREAAADRRRAEADRMAREDASRMYMPSSYMSPQPSYSSPSSNYAPSYSNESRAGTPSGRSPGRPRGSTAERYAAGIMPGTQRGWDQLRRDGVID